MAAEVIEDDINAAARIIGDISLGIYRSPANALKELVSNAFDAGATEVLINTDHPGFTGVSCFDNGPGLSAEELGRVFSYIGGSDKRLDTDIGKYGRPIIGKIGIGILAMAQISKRFLIISSREGEDTRLEAEINIEEFATEEAARTHLGKGKIGRYRIYKLPESQSSHYTIVTTPVGSEMLQSNLGPGRSPRDLFAKMGASAATFEEFVRGLAGKPGVTLSAYHSFLWELAALTPVQYFADGPIRGWDGWERIRNSLVDYNFRVTVDGYELRKPIILPTSDDLETKGDDFDVYSIKYSDDGELELEGYIYHQRRQIKPPELQGLLIRIRNAGIGGYDKTLLDYPPNIGPMARGMSGEVYVHRGLEEALNIDRNSFNETHPHFVKLREVIFSRLGVPGQTGITQEIRQRSRRHREAERGERAASQLRDLVRRAEKASRRKLKFVARDGAESPVDLDVQRGEVRVNQMHDTVPKSMVARTEFFRVLLAVEMFNKLGPAPGDDPGLTGWLRRF